MSYAWDAFISYSHLDDLSPSEASGWVSRFRKQLIVLLTQRLGRPAQIWHDDKLTGERLFDRTIQTAIGKSAVLIALYSASYKTSDYCTQEREWFARSGIIVGDQKRIFLVRLVDISHEKWPKEFEGCTGFDFFSKKANDPVGFPLDPDKRAFSSALKNVVVALDNVLVALEKTPVEHPPEILVPAKESDGPIAAAAPVSKETREFELLKAAFKDDFQRSVGQIKLLSARKDLHDQLHELQFKFYTPVSEIVLRRSLPVDVQLLNTVRDHNFTLSEILDNLRVIAARKLLPDPEMTWLEDISKAQKLLDAGMRAFDIAPLRSAVLAVGRVLAVWPSRINAKLSENARELGLACLASRLEGLCTRSTTFAQLLGDKVQKLRDLHVEISELAVVHDHWQTYDDEMRLLEATLNQSLSDIAAVWPGLREKARTLYATNPATWAQRLNFLGGEMDRALQAQDIASAQKCFIRLRSAARDRFYLADQELKNGCHALEQVGEPINTVLRVE